LYSDLSDIILFCIGESYQRNTLSYKRICFVVRQKHSIIIRYYGASTQLACYADVLILIQLFRYNTTNFNLIHQILVLTLQFVRQNLLSQTVLYAAELFTDICQEYSLRASVISCWD